MSECGKRTLESNSRLGQQIDQGELETRFPSPSPLVLGKERK
jgi:hypothetical protein